MIKKIIHFFIGHEWSEWIEPDNSGYEGERWETRACGCGALEERDI